MTRLTWDVDDYLYGVSKGVFYPQNSPGEVWPGLIEIQDSTEHFDVRVTQLDGHKLHQTRRSQTFKGKIMTYAFPESYFTGIHRGRPKPFGFSWRVEHETGYEIHILYNTLVNPEVVERNQTDVSEYEVSISTSPVLLPEGGFTSHLIVDSGIAYPEAISDLEDVLYGTDTTDPRLPDVLGVLEVFEENSILRVIDNGDGSFTVIGPDEAISMIDSTTFEITWPSAEFIDAESYTIHSL